MTQKGGNTLADLRRNHVKVVVNKELSKKDLVWFETATAGSYLGVHDGALVFEANKQIHVIIDELSLLNEKGIGVQEATFVSFSILEGNVQQRQEEIVKYLGNIVKTTKDALGRVVKCLTPKFSHTVKTWEEEYDPRTGRLLRRRVVNTQTRLEFGETTCAIE